MSNDIKKYSQMLESDPIYVADELHKIIKVMVNRMSFESRQNAFKNLQGRIQEFNVIELSNKKSPGGASIGVSLSLVKNVLNGRDPYFVNLVIQELARKL
tara:strand:- start:3598 stop:3897 length:300 start_codon:yes stop_codon:yes gene_type:complete